MFVITTRREAVNSITWLFQCSSSCKKAITIKRETELYSYKSRSKSQILKNFRFVWDCGVCRNHEESTGYQHNLVLSTIKFL